MISESMIVTFKNIFPKHVWVVAYVKGLFLTSYMVFLCIQVFHQDVYL